MQSPTANTPGSEVRSCSSAATPLSIAMPDPSSQPTSGRTPTAVTTSSGGQPAAGQRQAARLDGRHLLAEPELDAGLGVPRGGQRAELCAERRGQRRRRGLEHGHLAASGRRRCRELGADPAGADDRQPQPRAQQRPQRQRVVHRAQEPLPAAARQAYRRGPGGQHQAVKPVLGPAGPQHAVVQAGRRLAEAQLYIERVQVVT